MEQGAKRVGLDLTEGNILRQLIAFVLPLLLANIVQQLYNTVDMIVIGQFVGSAGTAGVSNGGEIATLLTFIATSFGSASQIYVAQLSGARDRESIRQTMSTAMLSIIGFSCVLAVGCLVFCEALLRWLNCPPEAWEQARDYMRIVSLGLPFVFGYNTVCGLLRGMGEAKRPLLFVIVAALANVVMDLLLVAGLRMEAAGTAIATIAAQLASFLAALLFLYRRREHFGLELRARSFRIYKRHLLVLLKLGIPLTAQSALIHFTQLICTRRINLYGLVASTTNNVGNKIQKLVNNFAYSITTGAGAMIGQNIGAEKYDRVKKIVRTTIACASLFAALAVLVAVFLPRQAFSLFIKSDDPNFAEIVKLGTAYLHTAIIIFAAAPVQGSVSAVVTGSGNARLSLISGLLDGVVLRLSLSFLLAYTFDLGVVGFFFGNALARLGPLVVGGIYYLSGRWKTFKLLKKAE